jgi:hypothetical protein
LKSRVFKTDFNCDAGAPVLPSSFLLFDMRLLVFLSTAVSGPQVIKAIKPRSIIYAVIIHEVCSALDWGQKEQLGERGARIPQSSLPRLLPDSRKWLLARSRGRLPNHYLGHFRPLS